MEKIADIKAKLQALQPEEIKAFITEYEADERGGVVSIVNSAQKKLDAYEKELNRMEQMKFFEKKYAEYSYICGIDEVGRGPLAGPVVTAAVILPKDCNLLYINDSKKLSEKKKRRAL